MFQRKNMEVSLFYLVVWMIALSPSFSSYGTYCSDGSDSCQNITDYKELLQELMEVKSNSADIILDSHSLAEVVNFSGLSSELQSLRISGRGNAVITCTTSHAGFVFHHVSNLSLVGIMFVYCGLQSSLPVESSELFRTALLLTECFNIFMSNVELYNSRGTGMTMFNYRGDNVIQYSMFARSSVWDEESENGANGLYLLIFNVSNSQITFLNCTFSGNRASGVRKRDRVANRFGAGGGVFVSIASHSQNNLVLFNDSTMENNTAIWGGGMYVHYYGQFPELNAVKVVASTIIGNSAKFGGGGVDMGYLVFNQLLTTVAYNSISFVDTRFYSNMAERFGGGLSIYGTRSLSASNSDYVTFKGCEWENNTAVSGSAVDLAPIFYTVLGRGIFPSASFMDSVFKSNFVQSNKTVLREGIEYSPIGTGTIFVEGFQISFGGNIVFEENGESALVLSSASADIRVGANVSFLRNLGRNGAAIAMNGLSLLLVENNSIVTFIGNRANFKGGAIYVSTNDIQDYTASRTCFILFNGQTKNESNVFFVFRDNKAGRVGNDVYASSTAACSYHDSHGNSTMSAFLNIGSVESDNFDLVTNAINFEIKENSSYLNEIVPGDSGYSIPIIAKDEHNQQKDIIYEVIKEEQPSPIRPNVTFVTQDKIRFVGSVNATGTFRIESANYLLEFNISSSLSCPPGYVLHEGEKCICGEQFYFGVGLCNMTGAYIINGFWMGLCNNGSTDLCTAHCPLGFCVYNQLLHGANVHKLPYRFQDLDAFICGPTRMGVVCGSCRENYSAFYHSYHYRCGRNTKGCKFGIVLYIVSELLPLTFMFLIVIWFEVSFTSGKVNGFILFAQVLDSISIDANGVIALPKALQIVTNIHRFVYRTFNFDFFSIEDLSFCLWQGATVLDAMAMKYVTVLYAIILLIIVILVMNLWKCSGRVKYCTRYHTLKSTVIHGLTAFAVICYSQCARISFQIITPTVLHGQNYSVVDRVVFRRGEFLAFHDQHLHYAIPAILILITMLLLPLFLILYPLIFKLLALCKLNESKVASVLSRLFPIPLLDAFQSSFKDRYRFFAGFYFLYRLFSLLAYSFSATLLVFYTLVELQLVIILVLHAVVQPYKYYWHNVIDALIFGNLALVNGFTLYNYITVIDSYGKNRKSVVTITASIQAVLIYFPLLIFIMYILVVIAKKVRARLVMDMPSDTSLIDSINLPPLRDTDTTNIGSTMKERLLTNGNGNITSSRTETSGTY